MISFFLKRLFLRLLDRILPIRRRPKYVSPKQLEFLRERIPPQLYIMLAEQPDPKGSSLRIAPFRHNGKFYLTFFSSEEDLYAASIYTHGRPIFRVDRRLLVQMLSPEPLQQIVFFNPNRKTEIELTVDEMMQAFPERIDLPRGVN